jgi:hypothetical protein
VEFEPRNNRKKALCACGFVVPIAVDIGAASINTQPNAGTFAQQQALGTNKAATSLEAGTS